MEQGISLDGASLWPSMAACAYHLIPSLMLRQLVPGRQRDHLEKSVADLQTQLKHESQTNAKRSTTALQVAPGLARECTLALDPLGLYYMQWCVCLVICKTTAEPALQENKVLIQEISTLREQLQELKKQLVVNGSVGTKSKPKPSRVASSKSSRILSKTASIASDQ